MTIQNSIDNKVRCVYLIAIINLVLVVCHADSQINPAHVPIELTEENWTDILEGEWMVNFHASWCPACKDLKTQWQELAGWREDLNIKVGWSDITDNPGLSGRFMISGLPTIYHVKDGIFRIYTGPRNHKSMIDFIEEKKWQQVVPISRWIEPNSVQMSLASYSFQTSMKLQDVHNYLVDEIGLPSYISYMLFGLCTVILGTLIGLILGFLLDLIWTLLRSRITIIEGSPSGLNKKQDDLNGNDDKTTSHDDKPGSPCQLRKRRSENDDTQASNDPTYDSSVSKSIN